MTTTRDDIKTLTMQLLSQALLYVLANTGCVDGFLYGFSFGLLFVWQLCFLKRIYVDIRALLAVEKELTRAKIQAQKWGTR